MSCAIPGPSSAADEGPETPSSRLKKVLDRGHLPTAYLSYKGTPSSDEAMITLPRMVAAFRAGGIEGFWG